MNMMIYTMLRKVLSTTSAKIIKVIFKSVCEYARGWRTNHEKQKQ
jgi:hypothetical protein